MPFFLLFIGIIIIVSAYRNKQGDLYDLVKEDFFGDNNFFVWSLAVFLLGAAGSIKAFKPISDAMMILIILVIIVKNYRDNKDILTMFIGEITQGTEASYSGVEDMVKSVGNNAGSAVLKKGREILEGVGFKL